MRKGFSPSGGEPVSCHRILYSDVAGRLANRVQLTTDGWNGYLYAVSDAFENDIDNSMLVKIYGKQPSAKEPERRYGPPVCLGAKKKPVIRKSDAAHVSTSYVERNNCIIRQDCKGYARLTLAFSNKFEMHIHAFALHTMYHNHVRIHGTHKVTPAMAAGVTDRLWEVGDSVAMTEEWEASNTAA